MINILNIKNFIMSRGNTLKYHYFYKITNTKVLLRGNLK